MAIVLLFGGGLQTLSIARGLKDYDHIILNLADNKAVGKYSKFIDSFHAIELSDFSPTNMITFINKNNIGIVIPTEDEYAEWLSNNKKLISSVSKVALAVENLELFHSVIDKNSLINICKRHTIPHPVTETLNIGKLEEVSKIIKFPALIKPNISNGSRGICKVESVEDLLNKAPEIIRTYGDCTIQEYIENDHYYNVMLYRYRDGSWGPEVATKILRFYPIKGGSSSFCTTIQNDELIRPCKELLERLNWIGFADFDVLESGVGDYRIIEINPRVPASIHAAYVSGINFGQIIVEDLLNRRKIPMQYRPGEQLRFLGLDIAWFIASPKRLKTTPSWFKFLGKRLHYQEGGIHDIKAMIYSIWSGMKKQLSPSFRKTKAGMN